VVTSSSHEIVVTGASGFLGRAILRQLKCEGRNVFGVSRRATPETHQVASYEETPEADVIIHLAEEPDRNKFNRANSADVLQAAKIAQILCGRAGRVIYASSGVVYGDKYDAPFTTNMSAVQSDQYSRSKIQNERIVLNAGGIVLRLSNLYGRQMSKTNVMSDIMRQIPGEGPLHVINDTPVRDFLSVEDAARAFVLATTYVRSGVLNVGSGIGLSIGDLARLALTEAGETQRSVRATNRSSGFSMNVLNVADTQRLLGWISADSVRDFFRREFGNGEYIVGD